MTEHVFVHHLVVGVLLVLVASDSAISRVRRADFLDPDFGVRARLNLAGSRNQRSKCSVGAEADSEIPELGLDSGRLSVDCDVSPARVADAAYRAAKRYNQYRQQRQRPQAQPSRVVKRRRTQIQIDRDHERSRGSPTEDDEPVAGADATEAEDEDDD